MTYTPSAGRECRKRDYQLSYSVVNNMINHCQCDRYCSRFSDCCPDWGSENLQRTEGSKIEATPPVPDTMTMRCISTQLPSEVEDLHGLGYYMISDCPQDHDDPKMRRHCIVSLEIWNQTLFHYLPVTIDGIAYRNLFCALCFVANLEDAVFWDIHIPDMDHESQLACRSFIEPLIGSNEPVAILLLRQYCVGYAYALHDAIDVSTCPSRMGCLCLVDSDLPQQMDQPNYYEDNRQKGLEPAIPNRTDLIVPELDLSNHSVSNSNTLVNSDIDECLQSMKRGNDFDGNFTGGQIYFLKTKSLFKPVGKFEEICLKCDQMLRLLLSQNILYISKYVNPNVYDSSSDFLISVTDPSRAACKFFGNCGKEFKPKAKSDGLISRKVHIVTLLTGASILFTLLLTL